MKRDLMDILACPTCKAEFDLNVEEENDQEIVRGSLTCKQCGEIYPITDTIPDLRPPSLREGSGIDDFEDLDDFDDEDQRPIVPIMLGVLAVVSLVLVAIFLRRRASRKKQRTLMVPVLGEVSIPNLSEMKMPQISMADIQSKMPDLSELQARMPDLSEIQSRMPGAQKQKKGLFRR